MGIFYVRPPLRLWVQGSGTDQTQPKAFPTMAQPQISMTDDLAFDTAAAPATSVLTQLKKKEFIARVKLATAGARPDLRSIVDATLTVLGEALAKGEDVQLRPLGRARVNRSRKAETGSTTVLTVKLRRGGRGKAGGATVEKEALAVAGD
jgi:nucleoid DNA-binding protein